MELNGLLSDQGLEAQDLSCFGRGCGLFSEFLDNANRALNRPIPNLPAAPIPNLFKSSKTTTRHPIKPMDKIVPRTAKWSQRS
jgi:hypothetical protein